MSGGGPRAPCLGLENGLCVSTRFDGGVGLLLSPQGARLRLLNHDDLFAQMMLGQSIQVLSRFRPLCGVGSHLAIGAIGLGCLGWAIAAWPVLIRPDATFAEENPADALQQLAGGFFFASFGPLGALALVIAIRGCSLQHQSAPSPRKDADGEFVPVLGSSNADVDAALLHSYAATDHGPSAALSLSTSARRAANIALRRPIQPVGFQHVFAGTCSLLVLVALLVIATSSLTNVWNYSAHSYMPAVSPYSLVNIAIGDNFMTKVYEDCVVFFSAIAFFLIVGLFGRTNAWCRGVMSRRFRCCDPRSSWWNPWATGVTVGEMLFTVFFLALFAYWIYYWGFNYQRISQEAALDPDKNMQVAARILGHLTTLSMSFLLLPAARNSLWEAALGVPFERAIKYHRVLGGFTWLLVTLHMLMWMGKWARQGILWNNVATIDYLAIDPYTYHWDNFTIVIAETAWLLLTVSLGIALFVRRRSYETFYYLHQYVGILFFVVGVWHAWGFWYYTAGGMILWLADKLTRLFKSTRECRLISLDHSGGVVRLVIDAPSFSHNAGQYAFLNVPAIDEWQWHPFTVSSCPSSPLRTFHIKDMGVGTWTHELAQLALLCGEDSRPFSPRICVDAPYGQPRDYTGKRSIVLVAGGIGITPLHSILMDLYERVCHATETRDFVKYSGASETEGIGSIRHVRLVWVVRHPAEANIFAESLYRIHAHNPGEIFTLQLYCTTKTSLSRLMPGEVPISPGVTPRLAGFADDDVENEIAQSSGHHVMEDTQYDEDIPGATRPKMQPPFRDVSTEAVTWLQSQLRPGRPHVRSVFADVRRVDDSIGRSGEMPREGEMGSCMALVCGPKGLIDSVSDAAFEHGLDYHEEEFYF
jgi:predicted ferric reductase